MKGWTVGDLSWWILALTVLDLVFTHVGIEAGLVSETNPLLASMTTSPLVTSLMTVTAVACCLALLNQIKHRRLFDILGGLFFVKVGVMIMHVGWIAAALVYA